MSTPAGWYPDPDNNGGLRYFDGTEWTEHRANQAAPAPPLAPAAGATPTPPGSTRSDTGGAWSWVKRHKFLTAIGAIVVLAGIGSLGGGSDSNVDDTEPVSAASEAPATSAPAPAAPETEAVEASAAPEEEPPAEETEPEEPAGGEYGAYPSDQAKFVDATLLAREKAEEADNDLKKGAALSERNETICTVLNSQSVNGWTGRVQHIDANGEGKGVFQVQIADEVMVNTWNNAFSDISDNTLIEPGKLFDSLLELEEDDLVKFSGSFIRGADDCVNDSALTLDGSVTSPDFIFRFTDVKKIG